MDSLSQFFSCCATVFYFASSDVVVVVLKFLQCFCTENKGFCTSLLIDTLSIFGLTLYGNVVVFPLLTDALIRDSFSVPCTLLPFWLMAMSSEACLNDPRMTWYNNC